MSEGIEMQSRVVKIYRDCAEMAVDNKPFNWGAAETLAYATLVHEGIPCISAEDVSFGIFFHRHAVVHNQKNSSICVLLANIYSGQDEFNVWDFLLSEENCAGIWIYWH